MGDGEAGDVIAEVLTDHQEIKELFARVDAASGEARQRAFDDLVRKLAVHETAEQEIVHPLLKGSEGEVVEQRLTEEKEGEQLLHELSKMQVDDAGFQSTYQQLKNDVLEHAGKEEAEEHPRIREKVPAERLQKLAKAFRAAEATAPTRPHPHGPTSAMGNAAVGPMVSIMDRARDAIRKAMKRSA
jgi:hemerythrin superfamily protein